MKTLTSILKFFVTPLITVIFLLLAGYLLISLKVIMPLPNAIAVVPTATAAGQQAISTPVPLEYSDALDTYQAVATTAIETSEKAVDLMKWFIILLMALSSTATAVTAYLYKSTRDIDDRSKQATTAATEAKNAVEEASKQLKVLSDKYKKLYEHLNESYDMGLSANTSKPRTPSLSDIIESKHSNEEVLDPTSHIEAQQRLSLSKLITGDATGLSELNAQLKYEHGLLPRIVEIIGAEISRIDMIENPSESKSVLRTKLKQLLDENRKRNLSGTNLSEIKDQ